MRSARIRSALGADGLAKPLNDKTSPLSARLQALQTQARFAAGAQRILADDPSGNSLAALLREVNETLLGRNLAFTTDAGASLALDVAGRRVLRVTAASGLEGAQACLSVKALDDAHLDELTRLLGELCKPGSELRVLATSLGRVGEGLSVGLPVARLADHLGIDLNHPNGPVPATEPDEPDFVPPGMTDTALIAPGSAPNGGESILGDGFLDRFIAHLGGGMIAWLIRSDSEELGRMGEEEMLSHLDEFLVDEFAAVSRQLSRITARPDEPVCTVLSANLLDGHSIVCLGAGGSVLLGVVAGDAAGQVLAAWNAAQR